MTSRIRTAFAAIIAVSALAACSETGPAYGPPTANTSATVTMTGLRFYPETTHVKVGDTVEWRNQSSFTHSVNANPQRFPDDVSIPAGAASFDSGRIAAGDVYRHTFTTPGTYNYVCLPHVDFGMSGTVIVEPR
jgi:plastocyanin